MDDPSNARDDAPEPEAPPLPPEVDPVQRVEAEPMDEPASGFAGNRPDNQSRIFAFQSGEGLPFLKPPVWSTWICLAAAWLFLGSRIPFTVFIGVPINLAALFLALICLTRGGVFTGASVLFLGTVGSFIVYLIGLFRFLVIG